MVEVNTDAVPFVLHRKADGVWLEHPIGLLKLGDYDPVCDELCRFLEAEELGQNGSVASAPYG